MSRTDKKTKRAAGAKADPAADRVESDAPRRVALLLGNAQVQGLPDLPGIDKDLESLGGVLRDPEAGRFQVQSHLGPTLVEARLSVARVAAVARAEDILLIYYSGTSYVGADGQLYLPVADSAIDYLDATCLDSEYILSCLRRSPCRRQVLLIDGCNSGAFFANNRGIPDGFCAITSCGPEELCYADTGGGFFTRLVVEGLRGASADLDGDGIVTTDELFRYVLPRSRSLAQPTTPQMWSWNLPEPIPLTAVRQKVFVCYRRSDQAIAAVLERQLESAGYGVWRDVSDIGGGSRWRGAIEKALVQADAVIVLLSKEALESDEVYRELARAEELRKPIVPLRLDSSPLFGWFKERLGELQHVAYSAEDPERTWRGVQNALRQGRRDAASTPPGR